MTSSARDDATVGGSATARHRRRTTSDVPGWLAVAAGGSCGALARWAVSLSLPSSQWPWATVIVNLLGAFALGVLTALVQRHPNDQRWEQTRLLLGTGFCGAFTTYSTLVSDVVHLTSHAHLITAAAWFAGQLTLGILAAAIGLLAASRRTTSGADA